MRLSPGSLISVVGGGPAGLSAAIALRQAGFRTVVVDYAVPPIDKACGEGLMPDSLAVLERLGVFIPAPLGFRFDGIHYCDASSSVCAVFPNGQGIALRRTLLHDLLIQRAQDAGVEMIWGARHVEVSGRRVLVDGRIVPSQFIVAADGQGSAMRRRHGLDPIVRERRRYAFRRHYRIAPWSRYIEVHWGRRRQVYVTPISHDEICVVSMSRLSSERLDQALAQFPALQARLNPAAIASREMGALSVSRELRRVYGDGIALAGDASGSVDAITGEGMCLSFKQALSLAEALKNGDLAAYQSAHRAIAKRPSLMASLMLTLDSHMGFQRRALAGMAKNPSVFSSLLKAHLGEMRHRDLFSLPVAQFFRSFLEA